MFSSLCGFIRRFIREENGVTAIEYGLIAALLSTFALSAIQLLGPRLLAGG